MAVTVTAQWGQNCASETTCETVTISKNGIKNIAYSGTIKGIKLTNEGYYKMETWGASGSNANNIAGGQGGYSSGVLHVEANRVFYIFVGEHKDGVANGPFLSAETAYIFNGGGKMQPSSQSTNTKCKNDSVSMGHSQNTYGYGGGSTDIRTVYGAWNSANSLRSRIIVAGGGGGSGGHYASNVYGGGLWGGASSSDSTHIYYTAANGGIQTQGGSGYAAGGFGYGGTGNGCWNGGGSGGGGWYGGGGGNVMNGGGGSSYISGHSGSIAVKSASDSTKKCNESDTTSGCSISWTGYSFTNTSMIDGAGYKWTNTRASLQQMPNPSGGYYASGVGHSGNGYARITYLGTSI